MERKRPYRLFFLILFLSAQKFPAAQLSERYMISTTDSLAMQQRIGQAGRLVEQYPDSAQNIYRDLYRESLVAGSRENIITCLFQLGNIALKKGLFEQALVRFSFALRYCDSVADRRQIVGIYNNIGNVYNQLGKFEQAYLAYGHAARCASAFPGELVTIYNNLANVLGQLNRPDKAITYIDKAIPVAAKEGNYKLLSGLLINKGRCYYEMQDYAAGARYARDAVSVARTHHQYQELSVALLNLAMINIATGKPREALPQLQEALGSHGIYEPGLRTRQEIISTTAAAYLALKDYRQAEKYLLQAWNNVPPLSQQRLTLLGQLAELYAATGRYNRAYTWQMEYVGLRDSLFSKEVGVRVNELETKYRTAGKDREIMQNRLQISEQQKRLIQKNNWMLAIAGAAAVTILLLLWRYQFLRGRHRQLKSEKEIAYLKAFMEGEQQERIRIATELHDGIVSELAAVRMNLDTAAGRGFPPEQRDGYRDTLGQLDDAINDIRNTAHNLMPEILLRYSLPQAAALLCTSVRKTGRLDIDFQEYGDFTQLGMHMRQSAYRIVQELIHNIVKHARATHALVQLSCYDGLLTITVEDNGVGMNKSGRKGHAGMGLMNIERRVRAGNGTIEWGKPESGSGMNVHVAFEV